MSDYLWPHWLQHTRLLIPSPTPGTYSNSWPLSQWCHPAILPFFNPFSSRLQSFPVLGSFLVSQFFASGGQSIGASASKSILPVNIQDQSPRLVGSPCSPRDSQESSPKPQFKIINSPLHSAFFILQLSHLYTTTEKTIALTRQNFIGNVMSMIFNILSGLVIAFLPRSKCLII